MLNHSHGAAIFGSSLNHAERDIHTHTVNNYANFANGIYGRQILQTHIAAGAMHDSKERYDAPKCHKDTRVAVLKDISGWILDEDKESAILWLSAPAGSGKSAILQKIAEDFHGSGKLAGSFFFSRTAAKRNSETYLIATLVYQLTTSIPATRPFIDHAIEQDPLIFDRVLLTQIRYLILDPLIRASLLPDFNSSWPTLLVIDGLDECNGTKAQADILCGFRDLLILLRSSLPTLCLLIASRPEPAIRKVLENELSSISYHIVLNDSYKPELDLALYLHSSFADIYRRRHKDFPTMALLPQPWPSSDIIDFLVTKSSGQFIFASTVLRFIDVDRELPTSQLHIVMDICKSMDASCYSTNPFALLDELYAHVLQTSQDLAKVLSTLGAIFFLKGDQAPTIGFLEALLQLDPEAITLLFWDLHSIVHIPPSHDQPIYFYHASFRDFLVDQHRAQKLFVDEFAAHSLLLESCLYRLCRNSPSNLVFTTQQSLKSHDLAIQYSLDWWSAHYVDGNRRNKGSLDVTLGKYDPVEKLTTYYSTLDLVTIWEGLSPAQAVWHQRCNPEKCSSTCSKYSSVLDKKLLQQFSDHPQQRIVVPLVGFTVILFPEVHPCYWTGNSCLEISWFWDFINRTQEDMAANFINILKGFLSDASRSKRHFVGSGISGPQIAYICAKNICHELAIHDVLEQPKFPYIGVVQCLHDFLSQLLNGGNSHTCETSISSCIKVQILELENFAEYTKNIMGHLSLTLQEQRKNWEHSKQAPPVRSEPNPSTINAKKRKLHSKKSDQDEKAPISFHKRSKLREVSNVKFGAQALKDATFAQAEVKFETKNMMKEGKAKDKKWKVKREGKMLRI